MLLSFSVFREKIESGEKRQSIRKYSPGQYRRFLNCWKKRETTGRYNLFWHNPRNGGVRIKDAVPSDKPAIFHFEEHHGVTGCYPDTPEDAAIIYPGWESAGDLAWRDGFYSFEDMIQWFKDKYGPSLYEEKFMVIRWLP